MKISIENVLNLGLDLIHVWKRVYQVRVGSGQEHVLVESSSVRVMYGIMDITRWLYCTPVPYRQSPSCL